MEKLISEIDAFCKEHEMARSTFGRYAVGDGKLYARLMAGGTVTLATADRIRSFIAARTDEDSSNRLKAS